MPSQRMIQVATESSRRGRGCAAKEQPREEPVDAPGSTWAELVMEQRGRPDSPAASAKPPTIVHRAQSGNGRKAPMMTKASASSRWAQTESSGCTRKPGQRLPDRHVEDADLRHLTESHRKHRVEEGADGARGIYRLELHTSHGALPANARRGCASAATANAVAQKRPTRARRGAARPRSAGRKRRRSLRSNRAAITHGKTSRLTRMLIGSERRLAQPPQAGNA